MIIGTTFTYMFHIGKIKNTLEKTRLTESYINLQWLCDVLARLIGGLLIFFLRDSVDKYVFGLFGVVCVILGYLLTIFTFLWFGVFFIGLGAGIWMVLPPFIIMMDAGPGAISGLWGTILTANFWGIVIFGMVFTFVWNSVSSPLTLIMVIFSISTLVAGAMTYYSMKKGVRT